MSRLTKSNWRWVGLSLIGFFICGVLIFGAVQAGLEYSPVCQQHAHSEESEPRSLATTEGNQQAADESESHAAQPQTHFCYRGHTAEEWIGILTAALAGFTWLLAMATGALWLDSRENGRKTLENLREAHRRELRAYVTVRDALSHQDDTATTYVDFILQNSGQTPALSARAFVNKGFLEPKMPDDFGFADKKLEGEALEPSVFVLGPGMTTTLLISGFDQTALRDLATRAKGRYYAWGWVEYDDIFAPETPRRRTEFCFEVVGFKEPSGILHARCRHRSGFNAADEDCRLPLVTTGRQRPE